MATKAQEKTKKEQEWLVAVELHLSRTLVFVWKKNLSQLFLLPIMISEEDEINNVIENQILGFCY